MLFTTTNQIRLLKEKPFTTEKEMQTFCESNLELLLNLKFVATEFVVAPFRFDSVAYDANANSFVIIEYKNTEKFSVIDQGYSYIATLSSHKADFVLKYNQVYGVSKGIGDFDWSQVRVIFIAPKYTAYQIGSIQFKNLPMELWRIKRFEGNILEFERIESTGTATVEPFVPGGSGPNDTPPHPEVIVYTEEDRLKDGSEEIQELYQQVKERIKSLDDGITLKDTKLYIGFMYHNHNLIDVKLQKNSLVIWLNAPYGIYDDPSGVIKDVTHTGHHGNGDCQIKLENSRHLGTLEDLFMQHFIHAQEG